MAHKSEDLLAELDGKIKELKACNNPMKIAELAENAIDASFNLLAELTTRIDELESSNG